jgi:hypothetical protein
MAFCPTGRDDADAVAALGVGDMEDDAVGLTDEVRAVFTVVLAVIDNLDCEGITEHLHGLTEEDPVVTSVGSGLRVTPLERVILHDIYGFPVASQHGSSGMAATVLFQSRQIGPSGADGHSLIANR